MRLKMSNSYSRRLLSEFIWCHGVSFVCVRVTTLSERMKMGIYDTHTQDLRKKGNSIDGTILFDFRRRSRVKLSPRRDIETSEIAGCNIFSIFKQTIFHSWAQRHLNARYPAFQSRHQAVFMSSQNRRGGVSSFDTWFYPDSDRRLISAVYEGETAACSCISNCEHALKSSRFFATKK